MREFFSDFFNAIDGFDIAFGALVIAVIGAVVLAFAHHVGDPKTRVCLEEASDTVDRCVVAAVKREGRWTIVEGP